MHGDKVTIKTKEELAIMAEGGKKLGRVKKAVMDAVKVGVTAMEIEELATKLILEEGGKPSFKMVPGYSWTTCVNVNESIVHGIPKKSIVFKKGDLVSVDLGLFYKGFHTDTSFTVLLGEDKEKIHMLQVGKKALQSAIKKAVPGKRIKDISGAMEKTLKSGGFKPVRALVGHGVGRELHEYPPIPCFVSGADEENIVLKEGMTIAIEAMYSAGSGDIKTYKDGWTIGSKDDKLTALFEETVAVVVHGPIVLTA